MNIINNILVIGNGFDIAHGLPTKYEDFLSFISGGNNETWYNQNNIEVSRYVNRVGMIEYEKGLHFTNNYWYNYFIQQFNTSKHKSWINFEKEIGINIRIRSTLFGDSNVVDDLSNWKGELDKFTYCLNCYFCDVVNEKSVSVRLPDIIENDFDYVMSFNYTNTYERLYGKIFDPLDKIQYSYVHGKAGESAELVLGCDNLLTEKNLLIAETYSEEVAFEKMFQRTEKNTDKSFARWFSDVTEPFNLHIFGHSLGMTDRSLLIDLMLHPHSNIIIYYHSLERRRSLIGNLIRMLGVENYSRKSSRIFFKQQQEPIRWEEIKKELGYSS
ncbi:MAG: bacteriophage abortive infection AbiH family protein [Clostridiales bacterium]|nr:bacteriophage abortive infection AbiH family protein [Clostridiales bacterium]